MQNKELDNIKWNAIGTDVIHDDVYSDKTKNLLNISNALLEIGLITKEERIRMQSIIYARER